MIEAAALLVLMLSDLAIAVHPTAAMSDPSHTDLQQSPTEFRQMSLPMIIHTFYPQGWTQ